MRQIGAVGVRVAVDEHNVDGLRRIGMAHARVRNPVDARDLFTVELHLFPERATQAMQHAAFDGVLQAHGVDGQAAIVGADETLDPHRARLNVDFDFGDYCHDGIAAIGVGDAAPGENRTSAARLRRGPRLPAIRRDCGAHDGERA